MKRKICCFAGHGKYFYENDMKNEIFNKCHELITNYGVNEFWIGNYGHFDKLAANIVCLLKELYPDIRLTLVIPYLTKNISNFKNEFYKKYDGILMADFPYRTPKQYQIIKCNEYMVDNSDYLIACVKYSFGGAVKTLEYAKRKSHIKIFNFGELLK